jgi:dihydrofolate synthase/folylpolyglutamate synthase
VSVITSIGMDHCEMLGNTLEAIAGEKAGIIKPGGRSSIGPHAPEAEAVIRRSRPPGGPRVVSVREEFGEDVSPLPEDQP